MTAKKKAPLPPAQSAEAAAKVAEAKNPPPKSSTAPETPSTKPAATSDAAKPEKYDHDLLAEIQDQYRKIAKLESAIADLKSTAKSKREALATANRELRFLLSGQKALPFGKAGKVEKLDTVDRPAAKDENGPTWFEVREVGSDRHVANYPVGHPHLDDFRKRAKDFVVRPLAHVPAVAKADATGSGTVALARGNAAPASKVDRKRAAGGDRD